MPKEYEKSEDTQTVTLDEASFKSDLTLLKEANDLHREFNRLINKAEEELKTSRQFLTVLNQAVSDGNDASLEEFKKIEAQLTEELQTLQDFLTRIHFSQKTSPIDDITNKNILEIQTKLLTYEIKTNAILSKLIHEELKEKCRKLLKQIKEKQALCKDILFLAANQTLKNTSSDLTSEKKEMSSQIASDIVTKEESTSNVVGSNERNYSIDHVDSSKIIINEKTLLENKKLDWKKQSERSDFFACTKVIEPDYYKELINKLMELEKLVISDLKLVDVKNHLRMLNESYLPEAKANCWVRLIQKASELIVKYSAKYAVALDREMRVKAKTKEAYLAALKDEAKSMTVEQKEAFALYLLKQENHLLRQERGWLRFNFSISSHSMQTRSLHDAMLMLLPQESFAKTKKGLELHLNNQKVHTFTRHQSMLIR